MATGAVIHDGLATGAVTEPKISAGNVSTRTLANEAVETAKIADGAVTEPKLAPAVMGKLIPDGGTTGQVLAKASNADSDTEWATEALVDRYPVWPTIQVEYAGDLDPVTVEHYASGETPNYTRHLHRLPITGTTEQPLNVTDGTDLALEAGTYMVTGFVRFDNVTPASGEVDGRMAARVIIFPHANSYDIQGTSTYLRWGKTTAIPASGLEGYASISGVMSVPEDTRQCKST